jgi:hypothetical protein
VPPLANFVNQYTTALDVGDLGLMLPWYWSRTPRYANRRNSKPSAKLPEDGTGQDSFQVRFHSYYDKPNFFFREVVGETGGPWEGLELVR